MDMVLLCFVLSWLKYSFFENLSGILTLDFWEQSYLGLTRSISWLLMPWLLVSLGHLQPWYWLCRIGRPLSYLRKDFNYLCHVIFEEWHKMQIYVDVPFEKFSTQRVNIITSAMAKVMFSSLSVARVCLSVSLSVSKIPLICGNNDFPFWVWLEVLHTTYSIEYA